jgi:mono/diheme cytochrome c family protein
VSERERGSGLIFDAKDVQSFLILLGGTILFLLFFLVLIPTASRWGLEPHTADQEQAVLAPGWLDAAEAPAERGRDIPPVDPAEVMSPTPDMMARGKSLFGPNCASCHGESGAGDGPAAGGMSPKPRNLASPDGWKNGSTLAGTYRTLTEGIRGSSMSSFDTLTPKDRMALVHYVRSLGAFEHGQDDPGALQAMSDRFKTSGGRIPDRIPVSHAAALLAAETREPEALPSAPAGGTGLASRVVVDPERASRFLAGVSGWRQDITRFAGAVASGAPANGFAAGVASLTPEEWKEIHGSLAEGEAP